MLHVLRPEALVDPRPFPAELGDSLWRAFPRFALGQSRQPPFRPVGELIRARMWADFWLFGGALVFGVTAGLVGGVAAGRRPRSLRARALDLAATIALCAPVYWVALMTLLLFGSGIGRIVPLGLVNTGIYRPLSEDPVGWLRSLIVPWIVVGAPLAGLCLRLTAATMRDVGETE